ncbi:MAG: hypothetical protein ACLGHN_08330 [Bacteriovoracia bacterium]
MRFILASILAALSLTASAETCFQAPEGMDPEWKLPEVVCVQDYSLNLVIPELPKLPYYEAKVETSLGTLNNIPRFHGFEKAPFKVSASKRIFFDSFGVCSGFYRTSIVVQFKVDDKGQKIENELAVSGLAEESHDECHDDVNGTIINYEKI